MEDTSKEHKFAIETHIRRRYATKEVIGQGSYGVVWRAKDLKAGGIVAMKKIFGAFENKTDAQRCLREIDFLCQLAGHPNIVRLLRVYRAANNYDLYLIFELLSLDLHRAIQAKILQESHRRYITWQVLRALKFMHAGGIVHRDVKPANIFLSQQCQAKLGDFGLARLITEESTQLSGDAPFTDYVATRWYRAPEILLSGRTYTSAVDMWAVGCLLAEIYRRSPLFSGYTALDTLQSIFLTVGAPSPADIASWNSKGAAALVEQIPLYDHKKEPLETRVFDAPEEAIDLMRMIFKMNPSHRITAEEALRHRYVAEFHDEAIETVPEEAFTSLDDNSDHTLEEYREKVFEEITQQRAHEKQAISEKF
eukprot:Rmarinus@m.4997